MSLHTRGADDREAAAMKESWLISIYAVVSSWLALQFSYDTVSTQAGMLGCGHDHGGRPGINSTCNEYDPSDKIGAMNEGNKIGKWWRKVVNGYFQILIPVERIRQWRNWAYVYALWPLRYSLITPIINYKVSPMPFPTIITPFTFRIRLPLSSHQPLSSYNCAFMLGSEVSTSN